MKMICTITVLLLVTTVSLFLPAQEAHAATKTWIGGDGNWSDPANWDPAGVPSTTDLVIIDGDSGTDSVVHLDINFYFAGGLSIDEGDKLVIDINKHLKIGYGYIHNWGTITMNPIGNIGYTYIRNQGYINNYGAIENYDYFENAAGGIIMNYSRGNIYNGGRFFNYYPILSLGTIVNDGDLFNKIEGGTIDNWGNIVNNGYIENKLDINNKGVFENRPSGHVCSGSTIDNDGTIDNYGVVDNLGTIDNSGTSNNHCGGIFNNLGTLVGNPVNYIQCAELWAVEYRWGDPYPGRSTANWPTLEGWMQVRIENRGAADASNVTANITECTSNVTIVDGEVTVGDIPAGFKRWSIDNFTIHIDAKSLMDPNWGITWRIEYDDAAEVHHMLENVPQFPPGDGP